MKLGVKKSFTSFCFESRPTSKSDTALSVSAEYIVASAFQLFCATTIIGVVGIFVDGGCVIVFEK